VRYFSALESGPLPHTFTNDDIQFIGVRKRPHPDSADPIQKRSKQGDLSGPSTSKDDCTPSTSKDDCTSSTSNENLRHTLTSSSDVPQQVTVMSYNIGKYLLSFVEPVISRLLRLSISIHIFRWLRQSPN
jgi:hypothetical protein